MTDNNKIEVSGAVKPGTLFARYRVVEVDAPGQYPTALELHFSWDQLNRAGIEEFAVYFDGELSFYI